MPILIAPMAMQRMCHPDGELAVARAAASVGSGMILSTMSTVSLADVAEELPSSTHALKWFQVYVSRGLGCYCRTSLLLMLDLPPIPWCRKMPRGLHGSGVRIWIPGQTR